MARIYSLNPGNSLRQIIPEGIYNSSENFVEFLKAYYEWLHTTEFTVESVTGTFQKAESVIGLTSGVTGTISYIKSETELVVLIASEDRPFERFETIQGQVSGATARLIRIKDNVLRGASRLLDNRDVEKSVDIFTDYLKDELYSAIPSSYTGDKRTLAKRIRDYYQSKGHEQSYRFLMKLIYNQDIEISYPGDEILRVSDGNFVRETLIRARIIGEDVDNTIFNFLFKTIKGRTSGAIAKVIDIKKVFVGSQYLAEMRLSLVSGVFTAEESIYDIEDLSNTPLETTIFGIVSEYDVTYGGSGYEPGDILTVTGDGQQATLRIAETYRSGIDSIQLVETGYGYRVGSVSEANNVGTGGSGLTVMVSEIANTYAVTDGANTYTVGEVTKVKVINKGNDYFDVPTITLRDNTIYSLGMISNENVEIIERGNNYKPGELIELDLLVEGETGYTTLAMAEVASVVEPPDPPSTNYSLFSDQFDLWTLYSIESYGANSEIDTSETVDPFGTNDAEKIQELIIDYANATNNPIERHYVENQVVVESPGYYTFSVYLKNYYGLVSDRNAVIHLSNNSDANSGDIIGATVLFNSNTVASAFSGANSEVTNTSIQVLSNGWKRVSISGKCDDANTTLYTRIFIHDSSNTAYTGEEFRPYDSAGLYISHAQLEPGNVATTYIESTDTVGIRLGGDFNIYLEDGDGTVNKLMLESDDYVKYDTTNVISQPWFGNGPIERIKMINRGRGYQLQYIQDITFDFIDTLSGYGAELVVTGIMGSGANVIVDVANNSTGVGSIKRIEPVNFGVDYSNATLDTTSVGNEDANIIPQITGSAITTGQFVGDSGKVDYKRIQDSYFYQQYSYVIKSGIEISKYKNVLKKLIHPSGLEVFGEIAIRNNIDVRMKSDDPIRLLDVIKINLILNSSPNTGGLRNWSLTNNDWTADNLEVLKVADFFGEEPEPFANTQIQVVESSSSPPPTISIYKYFTFASLFGVPVYYEIERQTRIEGTVSINSITRDVSGVGTFFTEYYSSGDEFVTIDRTGETGTNKFLIESVLSDTLMKVSRAYPTNIVGAEAYVLSI